MNLQELREKLLEKNAYRVFSQSAWYELVKHHTSFLPEEVGYSQRAYMLVHNLTEIPKCKVCPNPVKFNIYRKKFGEYCSIACANKSLERKDKIRKTKSEQDEKVKQKIIEKRNETFIKKFWANPLSLLDVKGINNPMKRKEVKEKNILSKRKNNVSIIEERLDTRKLSLHDWEYKGCLQSHKLQCTTCGTQFEARISKNGRYSLCPQCYPNSRTKAEIEIENYLKELDKDIEIISWDRSILNGKELDIYLPEHNIAIEYNGLLYHSFWKSKHSFLDNAQQESSWKNYHRDKTIACYEKGIHLLHIFENEWYNLIKQDIWKSILSHKLWSNKKIFARKTVVEEVSTQESAKFLQENHLQGSSMASLHLALKYEGEIICVLTLWKARYSTKYSWEIHRIASKRYLSIVWGISKLYKYFLKNYSKNWDIIVSYADKRYSQGAIYETLWFQAQKDSSPNYFYFLPYKGTRLESRIVYQKHKLKDKLEVFDENLTETQNMYNNEYRKIYDCGNKVYLYEVSI